MADPAAAGSGGVPSWAALQRAALREQSAAAERFLQRYARADGTYYFRDRWPGMDGSDDAYEGFQALPLLYVLGGANWLLPTTHRLWMGTTWQFTEYGQVHRGFDGYYDWMHHGESSLVLYHLGLADPGSLLQRTAAVRFASMYTGDDPEAPNWDAEHRMIRSPLTGSRGPRFTVTAEDWSTHRHDLAQYHPPFEDLPGANPDAAYDWTDERNFAEVLRRMNERWTRGDVPLNLLATTLVTHAYLWTGEERLRRWVLDYVEAWAERAERNRDGSGGGLCPDNVGPHGEIGELDDGRWWGGYYGWWWPHGPHVVLEAITVGCMNAALLDGDLGRLDFARRQFDLVAEHGIVRDGRLVMPNRYGTRGWDGHARDYATVLFDPRSAIALAELSQAEADRERVRTLIGEHYQQQPTDRLVKGNVANWVPYFRYREGENPDFPVEVLAANRRAMVAREELIAGDHASPQDMDMHHWQQHSPVICEGLVMTSLGAPAGIYHGGLVHAPIRHFDPQRNRPGLPDDVAALVTSVGADHVEVELVNVSDQPRTLTVQAGSFGEHRFGETVEAEGAGVSVARSDEGAALRVELAPQATGIVRAPMRRHCARPSYATPLVATADFARPIQGRTP